MEWPEEVEENEISDLGASASLGEDVRRGPTDVGQWRRGNDSLAFSALS